MSAPTRTKRRATYEDLKAAPENRVAEILDGDLYTSPRPAPPHAVAASALGGQLWGPYHGGRGGPGGWWILFEPELHLGEDIAVPDFAGWRRDRMPSVPDAAFFTLAPDWVCEVVSPGSQRIDRVLKLPLYARSGVAYAWLVDPGARTLEILRRDGESWVPIGAHRDDALVRTEPFAAVEMDLLALWGESR